MLGKITIDIGQTTYPLSEDEAKVLRDSLTEQLGIDPQREIVKALTDKIVDTYRPVFESWLWNYLYPSPPMPIMASMVGVVGKTQS